MRRFAYCLDPVCLASASAYLVYRYWLRRTLLGMIPVFHDHFNDLLCFPIFLPLALFIDRRLGFRRDDGPPTPLELGLHLGIWSLYFEGIAPCLTSIYRTTADVKDIAAYATGALIASLIWGTWRTKSVIARELESENIRSLQSGSHRKSRSPGSPEAIRGPAVQPAVS